MVIDSQVCTRAVLNDYCIVLLDVAICRHGDDLLCQFVNQYCRMEVNVVISLRRRLYEAIPSKSPGGPSCSLFVSLLSSLFT